MGDKKKPGRFTLQFSQEDPQQRMVSELLEQQGRHKAQFIANAVLLYIQSPNPQGRGSRPPAIDEAALERMMLSIIEKTPLLAAAVSGELPKADEPLAKSVPTTGPWENAMGDDALRAINDTLAAFRAE